MEPVLGGRDDRHRHRTPGDRDAAAMEPVLGGRDDDKTKTVPWARGEAAMEPVLGGRDDMAMASRSLMPRSPQWSPSLADGTTRTEGGTSPQT